MWHCVAEKSCYWPINLVLYGDLLVSFVYLLGKFDLYTTGSVLSRQEVYCSLIDFCQNCFKRATGFVDSLFQIFYNLKINGQFVIVLLSDACDTDIIFFQTITFSGNVSSNNPRIFQNFAFPTNKKKCEAPPDIHNQNISGHCNNPLQRGGNRSKKKSFLVGSQLE